MKDRTNIEQINDLENTVVIIKGWDYYDVYKQTKKNKININLIVFCLFMITILLGLLVYG